MNTKLINTGIFFLFIFLSGFWLSRMGKPYNTLFHTIHKLVGVALGVYLIRTVYLIHKTATLSPVSIAAIVITGLLFLGMVATGGMLSVEKPMPMVVSEMHKFLPYLTVLSTGGTVYLLF